MNNNDDTAAWNQRLGLIWAAHLCRHGLQGGGTLVELGPGFSDKLARGLAQLEFAGKIVLVEPNDTVGAWAETNYRQWLPQAIVTRVSVSATKRAGLPVGKIDALAANHLLDDLILQASLPAQISAELFAEMRPGTNCSALFVAQWRALLARPVLLEQGCARAMLEFMRHIAVWQPRFVVLNHYPSWRHAQHGLGAIHTHATAVLQQLVPQLEAANYMTAVWPDEDALVGGSWLVGRRRTA